VNTAIPALQQAVKLNANFVQARYDLGLLFLKQEQIEEAQQQFLQALTLYPGFWEARLTLAKIYDQRGETSKAIKEYETVLTQQPEARDALYNLAYHLMRNDETQAKELLTRLTKHDPQHAEGWYLLGRLAEQHQQFDEATSAYHSVIENNPDHAAAHYNLGYLYQQQDQLSKALLHFQRVTELNPTDAEAYYNLGVILVSQKQFDQAEEAYQRGIALQPNSAEGQFNIGTFYEFHKEDLEQAKKHYQKYVYAEEKVDPQIIRTPFSKREKSTGRTWKDSGKRKIAQSRKTLHPSQLKARLFP
jgi:tetratricopeptide (TPR) repeat protein